MRLMGPRVGNELLRSFERIDRQKRLIDGLISRNGSETPV